MKKNLRARSFGCFILATLLILSVTGCSGSAPSSDVGQTGAPASTSDTASTQTPSPDAAEEKPVTLRFSWWGDDLRHEATLKVIEMYKEIAPHVTVEGEYAGADTYMEKLATQLATNSNPDIMQVNFSELIPWQTTFDPFADLYEQGMDISGFDEKLMKDFGEIEGKLYGVPNGINTVTMFLNKAVLEKAGINIGDTEWTWEMVIEEGKKVHQSDSEAYFLCIDQSYYAMQIMEQYLRQRTGKPTLSDDYTVNFTKEEATELLTYIKRLFDEGVAQPAADSFMYSYKYDQNPIWVNGKVGASVDFASFFTSRTAMFADTADVALVPVHPDAKASSTVLRPSQLLCATNNPDTVKESIKFMEYFHYNEEAIKVLKDVRSIPATALGRKIGDENKLLNPNVLKAVNLSLEHPGIKDSQLSVEKQLEAARIDAIERVAYGQLTPEQGAEEMIRQLTDKLEDMKAQAK